MKNADTEDIEGGEHERCYKWEQGLLYQSISEDIPP
jgi:hypothetical protein